MNEIKFRVWDINEGEYCDKYYHNGFLIATDGTLIMYDSKTRKYLDVAGNNIIEQYIGVKDKDGMEIYKNDVVELDLNNYGIKRCVVKWHEKCASWVFNNPKENYFMEDIAHIQEHIKIIGTIHEK